MFLYQCQLAWRSIRKTPVLCGLMVLALSMGVAAAMITYTTKYALEKNQLAYKNDSLFIVQTDSWHEKEAFQWGVGKNDMPDIFSYRDITALLKSNIPLRKTAMTLTGGTLSIPDGEIKPVLMRGRISTRDFFTMFDKKFIYGSAWDVSADLEPRDIIILSEETNKKLFGGKNSLGKSILFEGYAYQVVGVIESQKGNNLQDVDAGTGLMSPADQFHLPFGLLAVRDMPRWRPVLCPDDKREYGAGYQGVLAGTCLWITHWVEFSNMQQKQEYEAFIKQYITEQKTLGFYPRPLRFTLSNIDEKMKLNGSQSSFEAIVFYFGFGFLVVCTLNAIGMLMAKFMKNLPESGVRRALGANRFSIFSQHLLESALIGVLGGILGVVFTYVGLEILQYIFASRPSANGITEINFEALFVPDAVIFSLTVLAAIVASLCAGIYPSWRICSAPAAQYLKLQ